MSTYKSGPPRTCAVGTGIKKYIFYNDRWPNHHYDPYVKENVMLIINIIIVIGTIAKIVAVQPNLKFVSLLQLAFKRFSNFV